MERCHNPFISPASLCICIPIYNLLYVETLKWSEIDTQGTAPSPRDFHRAFTCSSRLFIFGGSYEVDPEEKYFDDLYAFDAGMFAGRSRMGKEVRKYES